MFSPERPLFALPLRSSTQHRMLHSLSRERLALSSIRGLALSSMAGVALSSIKSVALPLHSAIASLASISNAGCTAAESEHRPRRGFAPHGLPNVGRSEDLPSPPACNQCQLHQQCRGHRRPGKGYLPEMRPGLWGLSSMGACPPPSCRAGGLCCGGAAGAECCTPRMHIPPIAFSSGPPTLRSAIPLRKGDLQGYRPALLWSRLHSLRSFRPAPILAELLLGAPAE